MEEKLANHSRAELEEALLDSGRALQAVLATQLRAFDGAYVSVPGCPPIYVRCGAQFCAAWALAGSLGCPEMGVLAPPSSRRCLGPFKSWP